VDEIRQKQFSGFEIKEGLISAEYFFEKLSGIFENLKTLGVYNNTTIVLVSDHGVQYGKDKTWDEMAIHPLLIVKENNSRGTLQISEQLMSNADVYALTTQVAVGNLPNVYNPFQNKQDRELFYWSTKHGDNNTLEESSISIPFGIRLKTGDKVYDKQTWDTVDYNLKRIKTKN
jgi:arylsulfatase A-like enzyme